ncbi:X-Pro dipeptidyl-peptidase-domain-containing protein [Xylogone sp. PMI_703]|nr:X-Pro dipeptidyl-peptidase-domain-containing protein [Xylogone sp. PMI_703]
MPPVKRGWIGALLDRYFAWSYGLRPESSTYTIDHLQIPINNGIHLAADLYQPVGVKPSGTILIRTPYGIGILAALGSARLLASRGYQVLLSSCRGTSGSSGAFEPARFDAEDGLAVVSWMRAQHWYTGSFATMGGSYLGYVQWALLSNESGPPEDMKAAVITTGPHDFSRFAWGTGALDSTVINWAAAMTLMRGGGWVPLPMRLMMPRKHIRPVLDEVPLAPAIDRFFEQDTPVWLSEALRRHDLKDPYWDAWRHQAAFGRARIPILLVSGWYDILLQSVMEQYSALADRGCPVALKVGPWTHLGAQGKSSLVDALKWFDEYLAPSQSRSNSQPFSPVRIYITGAEEWVDLPKWPPVTSTRELWLSPNKVLSPELPPIDTPGTVFKFDPVDPTPAVALPGNFDPRSVKRNPLNDTILATRSDVVTFTTQPLTEDIQVCGKPCVELYHSSSHPYVDLLVRLTEVDSNGVSHVISGTYLRLDPVNGRESESDKQLLNLNLSDCAHRFQKGTSIRLLIAGGAHPHFIRNLGSGEDPVTGSSLQEAWHTLHHSTDALSKVLLPVTVGPLKA